MKDYRIPSLVEVSGPGYRSRHDAGALLTVSQDEIDRADRRLRTCGGRVTQAQVALSLRQR
jgi:hypothetical protein